MNLGKLKKKIRTKNTIKRALSVIIIVCRAGMHTICPLCQLNEFNCIAGQILCKSVIEDNLKATCLCLAL